MNKEYNPYINVTKHHRIKGKQVCCINHLCDWHYRSVEDFKKEVEK